MIWLVPSLCVLAIGGCHWLAGWLASFPEQQQHRLASIGGGASLAYVFLHLLPELAAGGSELSEAQGLMSHVPTAVVESWLFLAAFGGVLTVFSLNVLTKQKEVAPAYAAWLDLFNYAALNYIYAYSLPSLFKSEGVGYVVLFTVAISTHVLLMDRHAAMHHPPRFRRRASLLGSAVLVLGLLHASVFGVVNEFTLATASAFLGGGLLMGVFREELPDPRQARLSWLLAGCGGMGALLLLQLLLNGH